MREESIKCENCRSWFDEDELICPRCAKYKFKTIDESVYHLIKEMIDVNDVYFYTSQKSNKVFVKIDDSFQTEIDVFEFYNMNGFTECKAIAETIVNRYKEQSEKPHECKYCSAMTTQPDDQCYAKPNKS